MESNSVTEDSETIDDAVGGKLVRARGEGDSKQSAVDT